MVMPWYNIRIFAGNLRRILHLIRMLRRAGVEVYVLEAVPYTSFRESIRLVQGINVNDVKPNVHIYVNNYVIEDRGRVSIYVVKAYLLLRLFLRFLRYWRLLRGVDLVHVPDSSVEFVVLSYIISRLLNRRLVITFQLVPRYLKEVVIIKGIGLFRSALRHYLYVKGEGVITALAKSLALWLYVNVVRRAFAIVLNRYDYEVLTRKYGVRAFLSWNGIHRPYVVSHYFDRYRVMYIGRDERKGLKDILFIIPIIIGKKPNVNFVLIGVNANLPSVVSYRFVSESMKWSLLCSSGLFVLPTYHEAFPLSIAEALSCGLPVITYDLPELKPIYGDCKSVLFVKKGDTHALVNAIIRLLEIGDEDYMRLREDAIKCGNRFDWINVTKRELEIYREILIHG